MMGYIDAYDIQLTDDSIFKKSMETGLKYILHIDVDRLLAPSYEVHGLTPPNHAVRYSGWERKGASNWGASKDSFTLAGHSLGHFMSAAASFYFDHHNEQVLEKLTYVIDALKTLQNETGSPYIGGCLEDTFTKAFEGNPDWCNDYWVPWYGIHKIYQGLIDTYLYTKNQVALDVLLKFADWAVEGTNRLSDTQMQSMLDVEHGGMNEIFAQLYNLTHNPTYLKVAERFTHKKVMNPLIANEDSLTGMHANTQIPKIIGAASIYTQSPDEHMDYRKACENFFNFVVNERSYVIGGNSIAEHFEAKGSESLGIKTCESCNTYNMLRLTEYLFMWNHDSHYMDYYENALFNHILGQQEPQTGAKEYFISLLQGHHRVYEKIEESWWCCTGTGMENPARYKRCMLFTEGHSLFFNLYMPATFTWKEEGLKFEIQTNYPYDNKICVKVLEGHSLDTTLHFRAPAWISEPMEIQCHGKCISGKGGQYIALTDSLDEGDIIEITLPLSIRTYASREKQTIAFQYGPLTLGAKLKAVQHHSGVMEYISDETKIDTQTEEAPYLLVSKDELPHIVQTLDNKKLLFEIPSDYTSTHQPIILEPFYGIHHHFYNVYWNLNKQGNAFEKALNQITVDRVEPDGQQDELGHGLKHAHSIWGHYIENGKLFYYREACDDEAAFFSYDLQVNEALTNWLYLHFKNTASSKEHLLIFANGTLIGERKEGAKKDIVIKLPETLTLKHSKINISLKPATLNDSTGWLTEIRILDSPIDLG